jgi:hypothetical protein
LAAGFYDRSAIETRRLGGARTMKIKCPHCGVVGTDDAPYPPEVQRDRPLRKSQKEYAFEVRGNSGGRPARACLACGKGVRVTLLPPRYRKMSDAEWDHHNAQWFAWLAGEDDRRAATIARLREIRGEADR